MGNIAIIPARGGSKRIPKKNIRLLEGKPVISYPIAKALSSGIFDQVLVSTDDKHIADIAVSHGAQVPFLRSAQTSDDHATLADVLLEVISNLKDQGHTFENVCCILPTAALVSEERIKQGYAELKMGKYSSVIPVIRFSAPIQRALKVENGLLRMARPEHLKTRSQDLEAHFFDSGQFYWIRTTDLIKEKSIFMKQTGFIELNENEAQDIDTAEDWDMLELKFRFQNSVMKKEKNS
jgi:pseudaminic acid cytidylyltransferase